MAATNYTEFQVEEIIDQARRSVTLNDAHVWISEMGGKEYKTIEVTSRRSGERRMFTLTIWGGRKHEAAIYPNYGEAVENPDAKKFQTSLPKVHRAVCEIAEHDARMIRYGIWDEDGNVTGKTFDDVKAEREAAKAAR